MVFGPSKLPELGKTLGKTAKSFQGAAEVYNPPSPPPHLTKANPVDERIGVDALSLQIEPALHTGVQG